MINLIPFFFQSIPDSCTFLYGAKGVYSVLYFLNGKSLFLAVTCSCLLLLIYVGSDFIFWVKKLTCCSLKTGLVSSHKDLALYFFLWPCKNQKGLKNKMGWSDYKLVCILRNVDMSPLLFPHKLVSLENVNIKIVNSNLYWMLTWSLGKIFPRPTKWPILAVSPVQNIAGVWPHSVGQVILVLWEALAGGSTGIVIRQGLVTVTWSIMSCWEANYGRNIILENHIHSVSWSCSGIDRDKVQVLNRVGLKVIDGCCTLIIL